MHSAGHFRKLTCRYKFMYGAASASLLEILVPLNLGPAELFLDQVRSEKKANKIIAKQNKLIETLHLLQLV